MKNEDQYIVDSDVFITAKNLYYAFEICPGFWRSVLHLHETGRIYTIDRVRSELLMGHEDEDLVQWVRNDVPPGFFLSVDNRSVLDSYEEVMLWVQSNSRFFDAAKAKFATGADGWLVAYARVHGVIVVTNEQSAPESRREVKLPDVCDQFGVHRVGLFSVLRSLNVRFTWTENS